MKNIAKLLVVGTLAATITAMFMLSGCIEEGSEAILKGNSFYYMEPCSEHTLCLNEFKKDHFIETEYVDGNRTGEHTIGIQYHEDGLFVEDGNRLFPCHVSEKNEYVMIICKYEKEEGVQRLWRTREGAIKNKLPCDERLMLQR